MFATLLTAALAFQVAPTPASTHQAVSRTPAPEMIVAGPIGTAFAQRAAVAALGAMTTAVIIPATSAVKRQFKNSVERLEMLQIACKASGTGEDEVCELLETAEVSWWRKLLMDDI